MPAPSRLTVGGSSRDRQQVRQFPQSHSAPAWLKSLLSMQRGAMVLFSSVLGLSTIVYGYTVYTQSQWRTQHGQLERLQLQESQQGVMNEHLKQDMAQAAERVESGLVAPNPRADCVYPQRTSTSDQTATCGDSFRRITTAIAVASRLLVTIPVKRNPTHDIKRDRVWIGANSISGLSIQW